jgi:sugar lactone lactonase YvrE
MKRRKSRVAWAALSKWGALVMAVALIALGQPALGASYPNSLWLGNDTNSSLGVLNVDRSGAVLQQGIYLSVSGLAIDPTTQTLFVGEGYSFNRITPYDIDTLAPSGPSVTIPMLPGGAVEDLAFDGTDLWRADVWANAVQRISASGSVLATYAAPAGAGPLGIAWDGSQFWVSGYYSDTIYTMTPAGSFTPRFTTAFDHPLGLAYDDTDGTLWMGWYGQVFHFTTTGTQLGGFAIADGRYVDGLEFQSAASAVPEPATLLLLAFGAAACGLHRRRIRRGA